ncbi:MAG: peroxiredoxin [bacterium]|nr:peroxiredoxin [Candidatus Kapabacteria bacterium]
MQVQPALLAAIALATLSACSTTQSSNETKSTTTTTTKPATTSTIPAVGEPAPIFVLPTNENKLLSLERLGGKWVVLYFYPKNFTGGCTLEAQNFQRDIARYEALGAVILGVSVDSVASHKEFCAKEGLSFRLLSDADGAVSGQYGSLNVRGGNKTSARNTFVINPNGKIAAVFTAVSPANHSENVIAKLEELRGQ